ncbi:IclR family transcriptional regulator [Amycolatopsis acidiphila]|uniref:IclR family transcriptional regulator n=1 Tax=Amycolatopsis acidiphila TaxID=715473 RepID=A0A557ZZS0_9PSEU|nr:IclR family transcriptional regulator [Amycolatopsis acidiphila]TVT17518.1 IclR family transcriptional regulator [Amycolatopsis acidiphila]UIJ57652.1 IclR family transcriptional regulator [Amycolatopsis acidiphila]GHG95540.1 IclR family transcriptional regulator [Amycolatopsis acidiphila]
MKKSAPAASFGTAAPPPQYPIESVDNALRILLLLGERSELRLTDVAEFLGVASSTAHRLLAMLQYRGFIRQEGRSKAYRPGTALTGVAFSILQRFDVRETVRPFLERLRAELEETVHLGILDGTTVRFIDAIESPKAVRVGSRLGQSMPANCTSTGKAMLSLLSLDDVRRMYPDEELEGLTSNSIRSRTELELELEAIRRRGYATSSEESEESVASVAVAFPPGTSPVSLALNVSVPVIRMTRTDVRRIGELLRRTVDEAALLVH